MLYSLIGGMLMTIVGLMYLSFEDFVLSDFSFANKKKAPVKRGTLIGRVLVGAQV